MVPKMFAERYSPRRYVAVDERVVTRRIFIEPI